MMEEIFFVYIEGEGNILLRGSFSTTLGISNSNIPSTSRNRKAGQQPKLLKDDYDPTWISRSALASQIVVAKSR